jgi:hypothetical protein
MFFMFQDSSFLYILGGWINKTRGFCMSGISSLSFQTLPEDMLQAIFLHLKLGELEAVGLTSQKIYQFIFKSKNNLLWGEMFKGRFLGTHKHYSQSSETVDYRELCHHKLLVDQNMRSGRFTEQVVLLKQPENPPLGGDLRLIQFSFLPDHSFFACFNTGDVCIWNDQGYLLQAFDIDIPPRDRGSDQRSVVHVEGNRILLCSGKVTALYDTLQTYDLEGLLVQDKPVMFDAAPGSSCIKIRGSTAVRGSQDARIEILDCETGNIVKEIQGPIRPGALVRCVDMDDHYIAAGLRDQITELGTVQIWDRTGVFLKSFPVNLLDITSIRIQGDRLFIHPRNHPSDSNPLHVWSLDTFEKLGRTHCVYHFDVNDDYLVTLSYHSDAATELRIWDLRNMQGKSIHAFLFKHSVDRVYIRGDSLYLIEACEQIKILDFDTLSQKHNKKIDGEDRDLASSRPYKKLQ